MLLMWLRDGKPWKTQAGNPSAILRVQGPDHIWLVQGLSKKMAAIMLLSGFEFRVEGLWLIRC